MTNVIFHHGIRGQRWGVRRFQNKDGGLTPLGRRRYADNDSKNEPEKKSGSSGSNAKGSTTNESPHRYNPKQRHLNNVASTKSNIKKMYNDSIPDKTVKTEYAKDKVGSLVGKIGSKSASDADSWVPPKDFNPPTFKQWVQSQKNTSAQTKSASDADSGAPPKDFNPPTFKQWMKSQKNASSQTQKSAEQKTDSTKKQEAKPNDKNNKQGSQQQQDTNDQKNQQQQKSNDQKNQEKIKVDSLAKDANTIRRIADAYNPKEKKKMDLSKLSNKEMQDALQRKNLEKQYLKEFGEDTDITKAMNQITTVLGIAGDTLTVAASIESIVSQFSNKRK